MMTIARARPSIPEYPHIAEDIHQALDQVFYKAKEPKQALDDAASKSEGHGMVRIALLIGGGADDRHASLLPKDENGCFKERKCCQSTDMA
jgi:hypothetical protein